MSKVEGFLNSALSLADLEKWLVENMQAILDLKDNQIISLAHDVNGYLIQYGEGILDNSELIDQLERILRIKSTLIQNQCEIQSNSVGAKGTTIVTKRNLLGIETIRRDVVAAV